MSIWFQRLVLGAAGITALGIGTAIAVAPAAFYAAYGIAFGTGPDLLSELRAPGANLAVLGALILAGAVRSRMMKLSAAVGAVVFLAYAAGRFVGVVLDGVPSDGIVFAMAIELVLGGLCAATLRHAGLNRSLANQPGIPA
ncbi:MAG: DUF4345 domain-containing protein [Roseibium sp.]|nr:DUF4345 domain-containing protein [Roseibium sp.]